MATTKVKPAQQEAPVSDHPVAHRIPAEFFGTEYISRKIKGWWDLDLLEYARAARINVLLSGPTGPGKTSLVLAYGAKNDIPVVTIQCNGAVDPNTFWGSWQPKTDDVDSVARFIKKWLEVKAAVPKGTSDADIMSITVAVMDKSDLEFVESEVTLIIKHGGVLYLDEVNFLPPKVAAVFHSLLDKRRQITIPEKGNEVVYAHPNLQVVAAYNPDYEGTKPLNAAFKNRFVFKPKFGYDETVEKQLVFIPELRAFAAKLRTAHKQGNLETPVSTNMLIEFEVLAMDLDFDFALDNFLNAFADEERAAVVEVFDLHSEKIKTSVKQMKDAAKTAPTV